MTSIASAAHPAARTPLPDRMLLSLARALERVALERMQRREIGARRSIAHLAAAESARDRGCAVHQSLLPR